MTEVRQEYESLQETASEQISAALHESAAAAQDALQEARKGGDSALQEALQREADLASSLESLQIEKEVSFLGLLCVSEPDVGRLMAVISMNAIFLLHTPLVTRLHILRLQSFSHLENLQ